MLPLELVSKRDGVNYFRVKETRLQPERLLSCKLLVSSYNWAIKVVLVASLFFDHRPFSKYLKSIRLYISVYEKKPSFRRPNGNFSLLSVYLYTTIMVS